LGDSLDFKGRACEGQTAGNWCGMKVSFKGSISGQFQFLNKPVDTVVPVPAAVWLFGSGLLGLVGMARRKKSA